MKAVVIACVRGYAFLVSPLLGRNCRFHPTCSSYAVQAIETHGVIKGSALALWRILRCNPWHKAHYEDPVPQSPNECVHDSCDDKSKRSNKAV